MMLKLETKIKQIKKRDGRKVDFDSEKIKNVLSKAFTAQSETYNDYILNKLTQEVVNVIDSRFEEAQTPSVENVQDIVETVLILNNFVKVAKGYILYREKRKLEREQKALDDIKARKLYIVNEKGDSIPFDSNLIRKRLERISFNLPKVNVEETIEMVCKNVYNGMPIGEVDESILNTVKSKIEKHYDYSYLASRLLCDSLYRDILSVSLDSEKINDSYQANFKHYLEKGMELELISPKLRNFDIDKLSKAIRFERDLLFFYLGTQTIYDRYLLRTRDDVQKPFELPQWLFMRVAMGLALKEKDKEAKAIEFYNVLSNMYAMSSTPTLFNSGTSHSQMSSCYLNTVADSMEGIFKNYSESAQLSKWAGGIGTDWTYVRAKGAVIKGTNGQSQGIIPFIKIYNDVALAVNQGGKRKGAMATYLEVWHSDIDEYSELKKNSGDERRRAHDIHTAVFIPDLFMKRVREKGNWTLFSSDSVPKLHDTCGKKFELLYEEYEKRDIRGKKTVKALDLWKKILTMLFETGHPWITFKDAINVRNPQDHVGFIHCSNLCTEITLNTSSEETAVCNLASINLSLMIKNKKIDKELLEKTVTTTMRMLENVIDNNFYPVIEAETSNMRHRPVGLGVMGYQDALYQMEIDFDSDENLEFSDEIMELVSYYAIQASAMLAKERGPYSTFKGSKWDRGIFPFDTLSLLEEERGEPINIGKKQRLDWAKLKEFVSECGMRNSNTMAIAPTATISNITGTTPCIEPTFKNIYMKENLSGNFVLINKYLVDALEKEGLWNEKILNLIKFHNGSVLNIDEIPANIRRRFKETFEIDPVWVVKAAAMRSKWIDQAQSTNIFVKTTSGKVLSDIYTLVWESGLKTTYYLRTLAASQVTKTTDTNVIKEQIIEEEKGKIKDTSQMETSSELKVCSIDNPDCEACQ